MARQGVKTGKKRKWYDMNKSYGNKANSFCKQRYCPSCHTSRCSYRKPNSSFKNYTAPKDISVEKVEQRRLEEIRIKKQKRQITKKYVIKTIIEIILLLVIYYILYTSIF